MKERCAWAERSPEERTYHDEEWGVPVHDDRVHFEFLILEGAQAGLSWLTVLRRREGYRRAFAGFDPEAVARMGDADVDRLVGDTSIIRNRKKIESAITNAHVFLQVSEEFGSFDAYLWRFVDGRQKVNAWRTMEEVPATTPESDALSRDMKKRGFRFAGATVMYAHMQAVGLVNDHLVTCPRYYDAMERA